MQQHRTLLWSRLQPNGNISRCPTRGILSACLMQFARQRCPTTAQSQRESASHAALTSALWSL